jgi:hypothetical protein
MGLIGEAGVLSEPGVTSDKMKRRSWSFVRTRYDFGQNEEEKLEFCPNLV